MPRKNSDMPRTAGDWMTQIDLGIKFKEDLCGAKNWDRWKSYYIGNYSDEKARVVPVNLIFTNGRILVPKCYFRNPRVKVTPQRSAYFYQSFIVDSLVNYLIKEMRVKYQMKAMVEDAFATGISFGKLGFDSQYGYKPKEPLSSISPEKEDKEKIEYNINVKKGMPWYLWADSSDIVVPWGTVKSGDPEITDIPWMAHRQIRLVEDVKQDTRYEATRKDLKGEWRPDIEKRAHRQDDRSQYVELWEIRNFKTGKIEVVARDHSEFLLQEDDELQIEGLPYTRLVFNTHPKYFWGISDIKNLEPHQLALNVAYTIFIHHVRMSLKKFGYQRNSIKEPQLDELLGDKFAAAIAFDGDPNVVFKEFNFSIPQDIILAINEIRKTIREIMGYSRNEAGEFDQSTRRTATEANLVKVGSETRSSERRDIVADVLECFAKKLCQVIFKFWDKPQVVPVIGEDAVQYWVEFTPDQIKGEYNFDINAEDAQPLDSSKITQDAIQILQQFMQDEDFLPEERKKIKIMLLSQFRFLGYDIEKMFSPREGMGGNPDQPIPMNEWAGGMERGKQVGRKPVRPAPQLMEAMKNLPGGMK